MKPVVEAKSKAFHTQLDTELVFVPSQAITNSQSKYFITQERELSYKLTLHQHPYVRPLTQRLLRKGTRGLQAADTEYAAGEVSMPYGVDAALGALVNSTVPALARIALPQKATVLGPGNVPIELAKGIELRLSGAAAGKIPAGTHVTLKAAVQHTPYPGASFTLGSAKTAALATDTPVEFALASLEMPDGSSRQLVGTNTLLLAAGTEIPLASGTPLQVRHRRMRPVADLYAEFFQAGYHPNADLVRLPYPVKDLDFSSSGAYAPYNWELFFHVPLTIAMHLSKNQRFAEAQQWFHYLFDPTDDSEGPTPERFWKVRPFQSADVRQIGEILVNLATGADPQLRQETLLGIAAWKDAPFRPHAVARLRQPAYMYKTVMAYLDNLIAWGDSLFRQDTGEAVDEALMLYVLAAEILGPKPLPTPRKGTVRAQTYSNLRADLAQFGTVMRDMEPDLPFDLMPLPGGADSGDDQLAPLRSLGKALYFCVPPNDKLLGYWDTVADRLFKIHNSLNFQGIFRQLALFEPPIDPAMLARAAAAGMDIGSIVNGLNQPLPLVRFGYLVQKAAEIAQEVKSLGNQLLMAMERDDGEAMALLRSKHERVVLDMVEQVRYGQVQETIKAREALMQTLALAVQRYTYYERQLGRKADDILKSIPELGELDEDGLQKMKFAMKEPEVALRGIEVDIATDAGAAVAGALNGGRMLSSHEVRESFFLEGAQLASDVANILNTIGSAIHVIPEVKIHAQPMGVGGTVETGGSHFGWGLAATANAARAVAERLNFEARRAARIDGFSRRERDWGFQSNLAAGDIAQIFKQLRAAQLRQAVAEQELKVHRQQIKHALEIERFLNEDGGNKNGKKTNKALYAWMKREVKGLYAQCFQFAFDVARKAERALQHELGNPELSYLQFGYLAGKEGLLAGEKLYLDIKRMEMAHAELNQREYELTKHVSLLQLDPMALVRLRTTGRCTVRLPESVFDMDGPGHYFRRLRGVAVSIPCVSGPYASVNCTLTLLKSSIRKTPVVGDLYPREDAEDPRFSDNYGSLQGIVTSSAQNDSGLFEPAARDERYLPFENSGAISEWQLQLPADPSKKDPAQFDYETISDVILHLRYTAREGGGLLRAGAVAHLKELFTEAQAVGSLRLISVRQEFPAEWARFLGQVPAAGQRFKLSLLLRPEHYPFWSQGRLKGVTRVDLLARSSLPAVPGALGIADKPGIADATAKTDTLAKDATLGNLLAGKLDAIALPALPTGTLELYFDDAKLSDLWIGVSWSG
ncbi:MAG: insecticidal toxin protein [Pseudomonadota bacterium]